MRSRMRRRVVAFAVAAASALAVLGVSATSASALVRGHAFAEMRFGKGGVFPVPGLNGSSQAFAAVIAVAAMGLVTWITVRSDRRAGARLAVVSGGPSAGESGSPAGEGRGQRSTEDRDRKAA